MDLSTRLSYLFGTEKYVDMRRQLVLLREKMTNHLDYMHREKTYNICSGSLGEGVAYPSSDDDVMICHTNVRVVKTYREATQRGYFIMVPSEYSPGYCLLLNVKVSHKETCIQFIDEMPYLSSFLFKQLFLRGLWQIARIHGPCISGIDGSIESDADYAHCISCSSWPDVATDWLTRNRSYNWPSSEMIHNMIQKGSHVVPIGDPDSPHCDHEWRISFSVAERSLVHSFNHAQFLVYNLLRLTLKRIIEKSFSHVLCSYFMKTTLFYTAEKNPQELWREDNLQTGYKACLGLLYDFVDCRYCPNYFIPDYNMIKRKINHKNRHGMLDLIRYIHNIGIVGILHLSEESRCLDNIFAATDMEYKLDREFLFSSHLFNGFFSNKDFVLSLPRDDVVSYTDCLSTFWRILSVCTQSELIKIMWYRGISSYCNRIMDYLFLLPKNNKYNYSLYKTLKSMLTTGLRKDVTTGKLTMATYMYMVGKTESALYVTQKVLSEYPPYAIDDSEDDLKERTYKDTMCGRGYSIDYKTRHAYAPGYSLDSRCLNAFPYPLRMLISIVGEIIVDPLSYTYFLQSLCYCQLGNQHLMKKSTRCLMNHIHVLKYDDKIAYAKMFVCISKYVQGDYHAACRWLGSVYVMADNRPSSFNEELSRIVSTYLSCLLHKTFCSNMPP